MPPLVGIFYEPGAGGDFFASLLSSATSSNYVSHHLNGRIKVNDIVNDYEYDDNNYTIQELYLEQRETPIYTKVHPYLDRDPTKFVEKLNNRYSNAINIMLHRDPIYTYVNDEAKNAGRMNIRMDKVDIDKVRCYDEHWYNVYNSLRINTNIIDIKFEDLIKNPVRTITMLCRNIYGDDMPDYLNFSNVKEIYMDYCDNQKFLEPLERYWE